MTFIPDHGTWLTTSDGQPLASVLSASPDPDRPGCVCVNVLPYHQDGDQRLTQGTGAWRVQDRQTDLCCCIQALSCASTGLGYEIMVSSLGEPTAEPDPHDDDYLVMEGHDPIPLRQVLVAENGCAGGPYLRCEFDAEHFARLPFRVEAPKCCSCGQQPKPAGDLESGPDFYFCPPSGDSIHRWRFSNLQSAGRLPGEHHASLVRLRQRVILNCEFQVAMPHTPGDAETTVCIGQIISQQQWHKRQD